jgi:copper chaperone
MSQNPTMELEVSGMTCGACVRHVNAALRKLAGVEDVEVDLARGAVAIEHDGTLGAAAATEAITRAGYSVVAAR